MHDDIVPVDDRLPFDAKQAIVVETFDGYVSLYGGGNNLRMAPQMTKRWWIVSYAIDNDRRSVLYTEMFATEERALWFAEGKPTATVSFTDIPE